MSEAQRLKQQKYWATITPEKRAAHRAAITAGLKRSWAMGKANPLRGYWGQLSEEERQRRLKERGEAIRAGRQGMRDPGLYGWSPSEEHREMYEYLRKKYGAQEACRLVKDHMEVVARRTAK